MDWSVHMRRIVDRLGKDVTRRQAPGGATAADATVRGIYLAPYATALDIAPSNEPQLAVMAEDVPEACAGDVYVIGGTEFRAAAPPESDPVSGVAVIRLREVT